MFLYGVVSKNLTTSLALEATVNLSLFDTEIREL